MSILRRIANLFRRSSIDHEIADEFNTHITLRTEENIAAGMTPEEARRNALLRFGNPEVMKERTATADAALGLDGLWRDLRYAFRQLRHAPGFAATAIVTLALGIGANIVVFGVLNAVILDPLHVQDASQLRQLLHKEWNSGGPSFPAYEDYKTRNRTFTDIAAIYGMSSVGLKWGDSVYNEGGYDVTGNYFDMLGVEPQIGRFFHATDERGPNSAPLIVLSDHLWRQVFHADPSVIGATVELNKHPFTVIGVARPEFTGTERFFFPSYWVPMVNEEQTEGWTFLKDRLVTPVAVIGRLKPGVTDQQATEDLNRIAADLARQYPATDKNQSARLIQPGLEGDESNLIRKYLFGIQALSGLVLLATCANLASLFAARASDRGRELALRAALGGTRARLLRQLLTEAILVALVGGAAGLCLAVVLLRLASGFDPWGGGDEHLPYIALDWRIFAVALGASLASGVLFGLLPARQAWGANPMRAMKNQPADGGVTRRFAARDLLLGAQIVICTMLVASSLIAARSMERQMHVPLGFEPKHAMLASMDLSMMGINGNDALLKQKAMIEAVQAIPGVTAVGTTNFAPLAGGGMRGIPVYRPGDVPATDKTDTQTISNNAYDVSKSVLSTRVYPVSPDYFEAAGTRLLAGRHLSWADDDTRKPKAAVVNESFARGMWGAKPAIGQTFVLWDSLYEVVGVAEDGKYGGLRSANMGGPSEACVFVSSAQIVISVTVLVVRSRLAQNEMAAALQKTLGGVVPGLPVNISPWQSAVNSVLMPARTAAIAMGIMGALAAMLAVTGIFGMAAYNVSRRMKELGIRMALGARRVAVTRAAVGRPLLLLAGGSLLGIAGTIIAGPLLERIVDHAEPWDPVVLGGVILTMILLGGIATCIPARRALGVNPSTLMREE